jgi:hypothetical protein
MNTETAYRLIQQHTKAVAILSRIHKKTKQLEWNEGTIENIHHPHSVHFRDYKYLDLLKKKNRLINSMLPLLKDKYLEVVTGHLIHHEIPV